MTDRLVVTARATLYDPTVNPESADELGYNFTFYVQVNDQDGAPVLKLTQHSFQMMCLNNIAGSWHGPINFVDYANDGVLDGYAPGIYRMAVKLAVLKGEKHPVEFVFAVKVVHHLGGKTLEATTLATVTWSGPMRAAGS